MEICIVDAGKGFASEVSVVPITVILKCVLQRRVIAHGPVVVGEGGGMSQMRCKMSVLRVDSSWARVAAVEPARSEAWTVLLTWR